LIFTLNIIDFHSFLFVTLHFIVDGKIEFSTVDPHSHSITLSWNHTNEKNKNCIASYAISWNDTTDGSKYGSDTTNSTSYTIENLEACVTFDISVIALYDYGIESAPATTNGTTLPDGKWHVLFRFMSHSFIHSFNSLFSLNILQYMEILISIITHTKNSSMHIIHIKLVRKWYHYV
jgi:hypothetical protein